MKCTFAPLVWTLAALVVIGCQSGEPAAPGDQGDGGAAAEKEAPPAESEENAQSDVANDLKEAGAAAQQAVNEGVDAARQRISEAGDQLRDAGEGLEQEARKFGVQAAEGVEDVARGVRESLEGNADGGESDQ